MEHAKEGRMKVYINGPGHLTMMAVMPKYGLKCLVTFSRTGGLISMKLGI